MTSLSPLLRALGQRSHYEREPIDTFKRAGAEELARRIKEYWASLGHEVEIFIAPESIGHPHYMGRYPRLHSTLVDGLPRALQTPSQRAKGERAMMPKDEPEPRT